MALYFFDLHEGDCFMRDDHGTVCTNDKDAVRRARRALSAIVADTDKVLRWEHSSINVRCEGGAHIARIGIMVEVETQNPIMQAVANDQWLNGG